MDTRDTAFDAFEQPYWNQPDSINRALEMVASARDQQSSSDAYNRLLYSIGNNHAGTYFPVVLEVLPRLRHILRNGGEWSRHTVLEILIDLIASFGPEPGHDTYEGTSLQARVREAIRNLKSDVDLMIGETGVSGKSAKELLECIHED